MSSKQIKLVEVGPRDGLQNEKIFVPTETKISLIHQLADAGLPVVEATSFVHPKWVPQMADAMEVLRQITPQPNCHYPVLTPNLKGLENALAAGAKEVAVFAAASETFSQKNTNCSIKESQERIRALLQEASKQDLPVRGYVSCVAGCPYEGAISETAVLEMTQFLLDEGCYEVSLGDTIGVGTPHQCRDLVNMLSKHVPMSSLAVHFHDTRGQALANIFACLEVGITTIDASVAGLGGCPYAKGATGNVATEDVVYMLHGMGYDTGVDLNKLIATGKWISQELQRSNGSAVGNSSS